MSIEAVAWALSEAPDVPPQCLAVLIGLANHAHANGRAAYPSQERLAFYARKSVRSVQNDLKALEGLGLIRRGDQRHAAFLPTDRRPVVYELAMGRRRPLPGALDPFADPQSGRPNEAPDRGEADFTPVSDRGEAGYRTGRSVLPNGAKPASGEPSLNRTEPSTRLRAGETSPKSKATAYGRNNPRHLTGAALPSPSSTEQCPRHRGQSAHRCAPCRSELLAGGAR
jgi:hypothetical protein